MGPQTRSLPGFKRIGAVIGGGKIGIGKAAMFAPFNIEVTVLEKEVCLPNWDQDVRRYVARDFKRRGIKIFEGVDVKEVRGIGKVEGVVAEVGGKLMDFPCDTVMVSVGLTPNSEVGVKLGVKIGARNEIVIDEGCRTNVPGIYAVGDVAGPHKATFWWPEVLLESEAGRITNSPNKEI
jgi:dihydrolipoamide dehydrogenase